MNRATDGGLLPRILIIGALSQILVSTRAAAVEDDGALAGCRHRIVVSTDVGGTDPDDFQSMVHLLVYADSFDIEGLVSSPYGPGRKEQIQQVIDAYEHDLPKLKSHSDKYPTPGTLRSICKQGAIDTPGASGVGKSTEGSEWIIQCAKRDDPRPLHVLVWGGIEDLAQALNDAPEILPKLRVYWIGGPNKKWSVDAYNYIEQNHPKLWIIEANATYRGFFVGGNQNGEWNNKKFVAQHIAGHGALGELFVDAKGDIKMGDTPSVTRLLRGVSEDPSQPGWGGNYVPIWDGRKTVFNRLTTEADKSEVFGVTEFLLPKPQSSTAKNTAEMIFSRSKPTSKGVIEGDFLRFRFAPRDAKVWSYVIKSDVAELDGKSGKFDAVPPAISRTSKRSSVHPNWWIDDPDPAAAEGVHPGAKSVNRWRKDFLRDFAERMDRCKERRKTEKTLSLATRLNGTGERRMKPRVIVTSDGEIDDQCSMIRFMLYTNECDVEGIVSSSSQYHAHGHKWAGDDWIDPDLAAYTKVYPNLVKHDPAYPTPEYLRERVVLGNVKSEGDMAEPTAGSNLIVRVLLDETDERPIWLQAWGGMNTIARALKTIEDEYPDRMADVAKKCRFFFIWEQDETYQDYIRPVWGKYEIPTIISDQFEAIAYRWKQAQPKRLHKYFHGAWMKENILKNHGPLCSIYAAHDNGDFRSEGDSPAFLHTIVTGLRNMESPDWGGWGGRYVRVRENTWLDPVPVKGYAYPKGRWYGSNGWGRNSLRRNSTSTPEQRHEYFKPMWRWTAALQNDFAARADWCVNSFDEANHPPKVVLAHAADLKVRPGSEVKLSAQGTGDPDGDALNYRWWQYQEADSFAGTVQVQDAEKQQASFSVPQNAGKGKTIHIVCEVTDSGTPPLSRYQRVVAEIQ